MASAQSNMIQPQQAMGQASRPRSSSTSSTMLALPPTPATTPPTIPARSPRRPPPQSIASFTTILRHYEYQRDDTEEPPPIPSPTTKPTSPKPFTTTHPNHHPPTPPSPGPSALATALAELSVTRQVPALGPAPTSPPATSKSKREHALLELLSSERTHASDLALVTEIHIPLAKGLPSSLGTPVNSSTPTLIPLPQTPPHSSSTTSLHTVSSRASDDRKQPMSADDVRVIFSNIDEVAAFADDFSAKLEEALGGIIPGNTGEDFVGALFIDVIDTMRPIYSTYITRHAQAAERFTQLTSPSNITPALTAYLATTRSLTTPRTNAWDIPSLLIKPVQRLLKYPLLLTSIIEDTPHYHSDRTRLLEAREKLEELARSVNEHARRRDVIKAVLDARSNSSVASLLPKSKSNSVPSSSSTTPQPPSLTATKVRSFKSKLKTTMLPGESSSSLEQDKLGHHQLLSWDKRMGDCQKVCEEFAQGIVAWSRQQNTLIQILGEWNKTFGRVSFGDAVVYQAVAAFAEVILGLRNLWQDLDTTLRKHFLPQLLLLQGATERPAFLLSHTLTLHAQHHLLLSTPYAKSRPSPQLLEASKSFLALQTQLREEMPSFFQLFEIGLARCVMECARLQETWWRECAERWTALLEGLRPCFQGVSNSGDGGDDSQQGQAMVLQLFWEKFEDIDRRVAALGIVNRSFGKLYSIPPTMRASSPAMSGYQIVDLPQDNSTRPRTSSSSSVPYQANPPLSPASFLSSSSSQQSRSHSTGRSKPRSHSHSHSNSGEFASIHDPYNTSYFPVNVGGAMFGGAMLPMSLTKTRKSKGDKGRHAEKASNELTNLFATPKPGKKDSATSLEFMDDEPEIIDEIGPGRRHTSPSLKSGPGGSFFKSRDPRFAPSSPGSYHSNLSSPHNRSSTSSSARSIAEAHASMPSSSHTPPKLLHSNSYSHAQSGSLAPRYRGLTPEPEPEPDAFAEEARILYRCTTVYPFLPPPETRFHSLPFLTLHVGDNVDVLSEEGHPSEHEDMPLYVDDGDDCMLVARDENGRVGWVLASFVVQI